MGLVERRSAKLFSRRSEYHRPRKVIFNASETDPFTGEVLVQLQSRIADSSDFFRHKIEGAVSDFLSESRNDLKRWSELLSSESISQEEFNWLIQARVHLSEFASLGDAGLSISRVDDIRFALVRSITSASMKLIGL